MKKMILLAAIAACGLIEAHSDDKALSMLKVRQPNWKRQTLEVHSDGNVKTALYYEPTAEGRDVPVKLISYYESGKAHVETDLAADASECKPHGLQVALSEAGELECLSHYRNGKLDGEVKRFYSNGVIKSLEAWHEGRQSGLYESYHANGKTAEKGAYAEGKRSGLWERYYANGRQAGARHYEFGLLEGETKEWHENGVIKSIQFYRHGLLHRSGSLAAFTAYYPDRSLMEVSYYLLGQPNGKNVSYYPNGKEQHVAVYQNGLKRSVDKFYDSNGALSGEKELAKETSIALNFKEAGPQPETKPPVPQDGIVEEHYANAQIKSRLEYKNGKLDGEQASFYAEGQKKALINYFEGMLHGLKSVWSKEGRLIEEAHYIHGSLEGDYYLLKVNGQEIISHYKDNRLDGMHQIFYPPHPTYGKVKALEGSYAGGVPDGEIAEFNEAGVKIASTMYLKGQKEGLAAIYTEEGHARITVEFRHDNQNGMACEYFPDGKVKKQAHYVEDLKDGEEKTFHSNGQLAACNVFKNNLKHGTCREWNKNGVLIFEGQYSEGKKHGPFNKFDVDGSPMLNQVFENDRLVYKERFKEAEEE